MIFKKNESLSSPVSVHNEWDLLEEVIVGKIEGATVPQWHITLEATMPSKMKRFFKANAGKPFPKEQIDRASRELDEFVSILETEGVKVRRPSLADFDVPFSTPFWNSPGGLYSAMPRDTLLVIGKKIIEAPMAWRSRYFEINAFRKLIKEYFREGADWIPAPKPELKDDLYETDYEEPHNISDLRYVVNNFEPVFDAADFLKFGRDIIVQKSHVTNDFGIEWVRRAIGPDYHIHILQFNDLHPMHIDATLTPLSEGKLLVNPERLEGIPELFKDWEVMFAPQPSMPDSHPLYMTSKWLSINIFSIDSERVVVEAEETELIKALTEFGLNPIPCSFRGFNTFGGSFHCATVDIRRQGELRNHLHII